MADESSGAVPEAGPAAQGGGEPARVEHAAEGLASEPAPAPEAGLAAQAAPRAARVRFGSVGVALVAAAVPFVVMCTERRFRWSVPVGVVCCLVFGFAALDAARAFDGDDQDVSSTTTLRGLMPKLGVLVAAFAAHLGALALGVAGVLPAPRASAAVLVPLTFMAAVLATYRVGESLGVFRDSDGTSRPLLARHGFWLVLVNAVLFLPLLGSYSLSDPWETHYGEVAREMLARDDWISTWWAQDGWFWSKPVLDFWVQALCFSMLGVRYMPDRMLSAAGDGFFPQPEWAARMPVFVLTLLGTYALYRAVARVYGRRAGLLAGLVLTTMPYWYLIAHQTMTDMPYVSALTATMGFVLLAFMTDPDARLRLYEVKAGGRTLRFSALHLVLLAVLVCALPQILYLASRNLTLHLRSDLMGFRFHADEFFSGSGEHNCGLPGNQACQPEKPIYKFFWPIGAAALWAATTALFFVPQLKERRVQRVYFLGGWFFLAISMMAKGAPGLVLPIAAVLAFIGVTRRWRDLGRLEVVAMVLVVACVGLPWYVQMYARHGAPFIDRLIMHDMYKRAFVHVHDTNTGDDVTFRYYIWQLGYGLFPWTGLAAGGLLWSFRRPDRTVDREGEGAALMLVWIVAAFGMFTITLTKFHHYILPLVPPVAVLTGVLVDRLLGAGSPAAPSRLGAYAGGCLASVVLVLYGILRLFPRRLLGTPISGEPPGKAVGILCIVLGVAAVVFVVRRFGAREPAPASPGMRHDAAMLAALGVGSAVMVGLAGRDLFGSTASGGGAIRLMQLFTYNYTRPWPESLDFKGPLVAFTAVAAVLSLGLAHDALRRHAAALLCAVAVVWTAWGLDVYLFQASPHWGQRETILAYYKDRKSADQPLVAYQMNWKGENFYMGNRVPAFVSSGERFKNWVEEQKAKGVKVMYFTTEHGRVGSLKRELGDPPKFVQLTDKALNNKFFLARVEF